MIIENLMKKEEIEIRQVEKENLEENKNNVILHLKII